MTEPTAEQLLIIDRSPVDRTIVVAGPGTGKTFTLIARCIALADSADEPILVLSFTRAVVAEIRRRAAGAGGIRITASTIDGYAARIVLEAGEELTGSFDGTIRRALDLMKSRPELVARRGHVLVDEVQDLVPPRLDLVLALLGHATAGFTALGDPQQAIYDFEARDGETPDAFAALRSAFPDCVTLGLGRIHRPKVAQALGGGGGRSGDELLREARPMSKLGQARLLLRRGHAMLLTRTNGEALALADRLAAEGLATTVRQGAETRMAPSWIADFANSSCRTTWSRRQAIAILDELKDAPDPVEAWKLLRRVAGEADGVALTRLRSAVGRPAGHDDFSPSEQGLISTVHRAKGLEWDDVIVLDPVPRDEPAPDEDRVLFVASTRSCRELWRLRRPDFGGRLKIGRDSRWELRTWQDRPMAIEARVGDVDGLRPFAIDEDARPESGYATVLAAGQPVDLVRARDRYLVVADGAPRAETTTEFADAVQQRWKHPPHKLIGARVLARRSFAGDPSAGERAGLPPTGLWAGIEIVGLVRPEKEAEAA